MYTSRGTISMDALLALISGMGLSERRWLTEQLSEQVKRDEIELNAIWGSFTERGATKEEKSDEWVDASLAKFHDDWGGEGSPLEIAENLRSGIVNSRTVDTW